MSQRFFSTSRGLSGACGRLCWFVCSLNGSPNLECPHNDDNDNILTAVSVRPGCNSHANDRSLSVQREAAIIVGNVRSICRSRQCSVGRPDGAGHLPLCFRLCPSTIHTPRRDNAEITSLPDALWERPFYRQLIPLPFRQRVTPRSGKRRYYSRNV